MKFNRWRIHWITGCVIKLTAKSLTFLVVKKRNGSYRFSEVSKTLLLKKEFSSEWWKEVEEILSHLSYSLKRLPCTVILPESVCISKEMAHSPVPEALLESTQAEMVKMEIPNASTDYHWTLYPLGEDRNHHSHYECFAVPKVFLNSCFQILKGTHFRSFLGAIPAPMADLLGSSLAGEKSESRLHIDLGYTATTFVVTGGKRPYIRSVSKGVCNILEGLLEEVSSREDLTTELLNWLSEGKTQNLKLEKIFRKKWTQWMEFIYAEAAQTESYAVQKLKAKKDAIWTFRSELLHQEIVEEILSKWHPLQKSSPALDGIKVVRSKTYQNLPTATRLQVEATLNFMSHASEKERIVFFPEELREQMMIHRVQNLLITVFLTLGTFFAGNSFLEYQKIKQQHVQLFDATQKLASLKLSQQEVTALIKKRDLIQKNLDIVSSTRDRQEVWLQLFSSLECSLAQVEYVWLEEMYFVGLNKVIQPTDSLHLVIEGRMLCEGNVHIVNGNPIEPVSSRLEKLVELWKKSGLVQEVTDLELVPEDEELMKFKMKLSLPAQKLI